MSNAPSLNLVANGNVRTARFVKLDATQDYACLEAGVGAVIVGVSQLAVGTPPGVSGSTAYAATAGKPLSAYGNGQLCYVTAGGVVTRGDLLKADADGKAISGVGANDYYGAIALESGVDTALIRCQVMLGQKTN